MTDLSLDILNAIDQRIMSMRTQNTAWGTVVSVEDDINATVQFDGSDLGIPCEVSGSCQIFQGDRVGLVKFGVTWMVATVRARRYMSATGLRTQQQSGGGSTSSGTYSNLPIDMQLTYVKRYDLTQTRLFVFGAAFTSAANTGLDMGISFIDPDHGTWTHTVGAIWINLTTLHMPGSGTRYIPGALAWGSGNLPAGTYTCHVQWRRNGGTGTLTTDQNDYWSAEIQEVSP